MARRDICYTPVLGNQMSTESTDGAAIPVATASNPSAGARNAVTMTAPLYSTRFMHVVENPPILSGAIFLKTDFKMWQHKVLFYLTTLGLANFLREEEMAAPSEEETDFQIRSRYESWKKGDFLCRNYVLNCLEDSLYSPYANIKTSRDLWETLERKYLLRDDARIKYLVVHKFMNYEMVDSRPIMDQVQEFQLLVINLRDEGIVLNDDMIVAMVIAKLPPSWKNFKRYLQLEPDEMSLDDLIVTLRCLEAHTRKLC